MKKILKFIFLFIFSMCACNYRVYNLQILFLIPLLGYVFFLGIDTFLVSILGGFVGNFVFFQENTYFNVLALIIFLIIFYILKLFKTKISINYFLCSILSVFFTYLLSFLLINANYIYLPVVLLFVSFISFLFGLTLDKSNEKIVFVIKMFIPYLYITFIPLIEFKIPLLYLYTLLCVFKNDLKSILSSMFCYLIYLCVFDYSFIENLVYIIPSIMFIKFIKTTKKINIFLISEICILLLNLYLKTFTNLQIFVILLVIGILILLIPPTIYEVDQKDKNNNYYIDLKKENITKLKDFSLLFNYLSEQFKKASTKRILEQIDENVMKTFCNDCERKELCYYKNSHILLNFIKDKLEKNIDNYNQIQILENCLKRKAYLQLLNEFVNTNLLKEYQNDELYKIKNIVANQFKAYAFLLENYKNAIENDHLIKASRFQDELKNILIKYKIDLLYFLNRSSYEMYEFIFAINLKDDEKINKIILPIINDILQTKMKIVNIDKKTIIANYITIHIKEDIDFNVDFCYKQNCINKQNCGDYIQSYKMDNYFYCLLADGMGYGFNAYEESKFASDFIFNSLRIGMDAKTSIKMANMLLKLKNHHDMYTTIDMLVIDFVSYQAQFYKAGSPSSYLIRKNEIMHIENYSLPIGIVDDIFIEPIIVNLQKNDIIIMCSDGLIDEYNNQIEEIFKSIKYENIEIMTRDLFDILIKLRNNIDDSTLAFILIP